MTAEPPSFAMVLGSGFQSILDRMEVRSEIPYRDIPGFPALHVPGHEGRLLVAALGGVSSFVLCGRPHFYEGHSIHTVTFPVRVLARCGVKTILLTNAAGAMNRRFKVGDLMLITDHINMIGTNPLRGEKPGNAPAFVDLTQAYDPSLRRLMQRAARRTKIRLQTGIYLAVSGPSFETPAEIRAFAKLGASALGMSTVPETIVARACGLRVVAVSCITNFAAGRNPSPISHAEVLAAGQRARPKVAALLREFMAQWARQACAKPN